MIELLFLALAPSAAEQPTRVPSPEYRAAHKAFDECLINAAESIAAAEPDRLKRYRSYTQRCSVERAALIDAWMRANPGRNADERLDQYGWASRRAADRTQIWAGRFLDPKPRMESNNNAAN